MYLNLKLTVVWLTSCVDGPRRGCILRLGRREIDFHSPLCQSLPGNMPLSAASALTDASPAPPLKGRPHSSSGCRRLGSNSLEKPALFPRDHSQSGGAKPAGPSAHTCSLHPPVHLFSPTARSRRTL